jgi:lanthionine synthetase-like protein
VLYSPDPFEPLTETRWDEGRVRDTIRAIVDHVEGGYRGRVRLWPVDPIPGWTGADPIKSVYAGAAGTVFALDRLRRRGLAETSLDLADLARCALELFPEEPDYRDSGLELPEPSDAGLLSGETGILLVAWQLAPSDDLADALYAHVRANVANETDEVMWGTPGTLIAAATMLEWTGDERWRTAWNESAEALLARRDADGLWPQRLYGAEMRRLDPIHGAVGTVQALSRLLEPDRRAALERETASVLARTAVVEDGLANWPYTPDAGPPELLRWCAGAPGILASTADYLEEELLLAGAELVWQAGPQGMGIGPSLCCGTTGNGFALLKVFERTGDELWLERARRFAVHALELVERDRARDSPGWYSLWPGDLGVALFAADCLDARGVCPLLDSEPEAA